MARITCKTPSTGKSITYKLSNVAANSYVTIAEAPDFSVPDTSERYSTRDPNDATRAIRPGEVFFITPLAVYNTDTSAHVAEVRLMDESNAVVEFGRVSVPPQDTAFFPLQGRSIFKRDSATANGDVLQIQVNYSNVFQVTITGEEKLSSEHIGEV